MSKEIAPRLFNKDSRTRNFHRLPEPVKDALMAIATQEGKSMSWVLEEVIIDYFGLRRPKYKKRKNGKA